MEITDLKGRHAGKPGFCLGTAPHLSQLDLNLLREHITIGCNQLIRETEEYNFKYICFITESRLDAFRDEIQCAPKVQFIIPQVLLKKVREWGAPHSLLERLCPVKTRFASPGHAEYFSFDLEQCTYVLDMLTFQIQLAVWMGCNPIFVLGVDAKYQDAEHAFYDESLAGCVNVEYGNRFVFRDIKGWLRKIRTRLWSRGIHVFDAGGEASLLDVLPKCRLKAATGNPRIAVTSKTFSNDSYLVGELQRFFPDVKINDGKKTLDDERLVEFLADADGVILGTESFTAGVMEKLPCLRFVSKYGVGLDNIDFEAATRHRIQIHSRKGVNSDSVAELTICLALALLRHTDESIQGYRSGAWTKVPGRELAEITLGLIGYGHVGKVVARKFAALGVGQLLVHDILDFPIAPPVEFVPIEYLLQEADVVTLHISMEENNRHFVNEAFLDRMSPGGYLINTSRGEVVDEAALAKALRRGSLAGAALDVYEQEPKINEELAKFPNLLATCHIAGSSNRAIKNMGWAAIEGLLELFNRAPL